MREKNEEKLVPEATQGKKITGRTGCSFIE